MIFRSVIDFFFHCIILLNVTKYFVRGNVKTFNYKLNTLEVHKDKIYIGGTNTITRLNTELNVLAQTTNGPVMNNKNCHPISLDKLKCFREKENHKLSLEDNVNKILLYTEKPIDMVIACGSIYQGICQFLDTTTLKNITAIYDKPMLTRRMVNQEKYVSSNGPDTSATAFILYSDTNVYLVNAKTVTIKPLISSTPAISALPLGLELTDEFYVNADDKYKMEYRSFYNNNTAKYNVDYKSSFKLGDFIYFTTIQQNLQTETPSTLSKVVEIRFDNSNGLSRYVEVPLYCEKDGVRYNDIVSSTVAKLNSSDIISGVSAGESVLFGVFKSSTLGTYAVCSFSVKEIHNKTEEIRNKCVRSGATNEDKVPWDIVTQGRCYVSIENYFFFFMKMQLFFITT